MEGFYFIFADCNVILSAQQIDVSKALFFPIFFPLKILTHIFCELKKKLFDKPKKYVCPLMYYTLFTEESDAFQWVDAPN